MTYNWNVFVINIKYIELREIEENIQHIGDWLKYHKTLKNISYNELSHIIGLTKRCFGKIEEGSIFPGRQASKKLASYFNLPTKYFYDPYLEETENIHIKLKDYREKNKLKIKEAAKIINTHESNWSSWENEKYIPSRENYYKLKELNIL